MACSGVTFTFILPLNIKQLPTSSCDIQEHDVTPKNLHPLIFILIRRKEIKCRLKNVEMIPKLWVSLFMYPDHKDREFKLFKPHGHVMHQQFNIQQLYALPTLYLCVLYLSENKQRLVPLTA